MLLVREDCPRPIILMLLLLSLLSLLLFSLVLSAENMARSLGKNLETSVGSAKPRIMFPQFLQQRDCVLLLSWMSPPKSLLLLLLLF